MSSHTYRPPEDIHSILMAQLPTWYKPILEYIALMRGYAVTVSDAEMLAAKICDNFFIQTADSDTIEAWESMLGYAARYDEPISYRRERILNDLRSKAPYTIVSLIMDLQDLFGDDFECEVDVDDLTATITTTSDRYGAVDLLRDLIHRVIPAHLFVISNQQVTNYCVSRAYYGTRISRTYEQTIGA